MAHAEQNQLAVIPQLFYRYYKQGYINFLAQDENFSSSDLLEDHRERTENSEGNEVKTQWKSTDVVRMLQVLVMSLSGEARRNEMVLMAILSLKPLLTATCTATGVTILGRTRKYSVSCGSIPSIGTWEPLNHSKLVQLTYFHREPFNSQKPSRSQTAWNCSVLSSKSIKCLKHNDNNILYLPQERCFMEQCY